MADADRTCGDCGFVSKSPRGLTLHRNAKHPPEVEGHVYSETVKAIESADHLTPMDAGMVAVLLRLARVIDGMDDRDADAPLDNVTVPTYRKYSEDLALTPLARLRLPKGEDKGGSKLSQLRQRPQLHAVRSGQEAS